MNEENMSVEDHGSNGNNKRGSEVSHDLQRIATQIEDLFDEFARRIEKKVDELSLAFEEKLTIALDRVLREVDDRVSKRTPGISENAEGGSENPPKKRKLYHISLDGTDYVYIHSTDDPDGRKEMYTEALMQVGTSQTEVNSVYPTLFPETNSELPHSSKSPNALTVAPTFSSERVGPSRSIPTSVPHASHDRVSAFLPDVSRPCGAEEGLEEGNSAKPNVKQNHTFDPSAPATPHTAANDTSTSHTKGNNLQEVTGNDKKKLRPLQDHFNHYHSDPEEESSNDVAEELMTTASETISSQTEEQSKGNQTGYTEMLDFQSAISGYNPPNTTVNIAIPCDSNTNFRPFSNSSLRFTSSDVGYILRDCFSKERSLDPSYDTTFPIEEDQPSETIAPSQPFPAEPCPLSEPCIRGPPKNSYTNEKNLPGKETSGKTDALKKLRVTLTRNNTAIPAFDNPGPQQIEVINDTYESISPPVATRRELHTIAHNTKKEKGSKASSSGTRSKFRVPKRIISSNNCKPSEISGIMSSTISSMSTSSVFKSLAEKILEDKRALGDTTTIATAPRVRSETAAAARVTKQQSDMPRALTCKTPFEALEAQDLTTTNRSPSSISGLPPALSHSPPLGVPSPTTEGRVDQSKELSDSSQSTSTHRLPSGTSPAPDLESTTGGLVDQLKVLSPQSMATCRPTSTTSHPSSRTSPSSHLASTNERMGVEWKPLSDSSQKSFTHRLPTTSRPSPTSSPSENLESIIGKQVDQWKPTSDSSQNTSSHQPFATTFRPSPLPSHPDLKSTNNTSGVESKLLSDSSHSSTTHQPPATTSRLSPTTSSPNLESTTSKRVDQSRPTSDSSQSSITQRPPTTTSRPSPTTPPPGVFDWNSERRADQSRALRAAAAEGRITDLRRLLADGADPDAKNAEGCTALHNSARRGMWLAVNALLEAGANFSAKDKVGWTALHCASAYDPAGLCIPALAKAGADVNDRSNSRLTPLHLAAMYNNAKAVRALLEAGACKTIRDVHGRLPIQVTHSDAVKNLLR